LRLQRTRRRTRAPAAGRARRGRPRPRHRHRPARRVGPLPRVQRRLPRSAGAGAARAPAGTGRARAFPVPQRAARASRARTGRAAPDGGHYGTRGRRQGAIPSAGRRRRTGPGQGTRGVGQEDVSTATKARKTTRRRRTRLRREEIAELFSRLAELDPDPKTELEYSTPFELLVAVVLSAQATDVGVNKATRRLFPVANTPAKLLALGEEGLKRHISSIGLFNSKAANVIALCRILVEQHGGEVPRTRE